MTSASARSSTSSEPARFSRWPRACPRVSGSSALAPRPCAYPRRRRLARPRAPLPTAAIGRHPSVRGRRSRPPLACACGRRSALPACATTKSTWDRPCASWPSFWSVLGVILHQLLRKVHVAAKVRNEQLVLPVQRHALAKDAKVEFVGRLDEAFAQCFVCFWSSRRRHGSASSFHPA